MLPTPKSLGFQSKFANWRPNQPRAIEDALRCKKRFKLQVQRAGAGKSVTCMAIGQLEPNSRLVYLTPTKALQDQLLEDFEESLGLVAIKGKTAYDCSVIPGSNCEEGTLAKCLYKGSALCEHWAAKATAGDARLLTTNYSCWMASNKYGQGFGKFDILVLDEAHNAPLELAKAMQVRLSTSEVEELLKAEWPDHNKRESMADWKHWALVTRKISDMRLQSLKAAVESGGKSSLADVRRFRHMKNLSRKLADIATCNVDKWVCDEWLHGYQFDPIDASEYAERLLFCGIESVILTSGTIMPKTVEMLGLSSADYEFFDYPSAIDVHRSPLYHIPTIKVSKNSQPWELKKLVKRIDEIFESRADRKGIIHTVNYRLRDFIMSNSRYSRYMVSNYAGESETTSGVIARFKAMKPPAVMVSPSITTGYDFPYEDCRYQIIAKVPFPDNRSKVDRARDRLDSTRGFYLALQTLAQAFGRGDRAEDDFQEVFILDDLVQWLMWRYGKLAPSWLPAYYRVINSVPEAPELD